ncbi:isoamylase early set domain-containing protein [Nonomuraea sp. NPDC050536]|uniref:isoamylase early set domain-containing protein n=1 Tax=Nonomuraea sp. NPDC050536 TaxID=3364366 RepID=UPI0037C9E7A7
MITHGKSTKKGHVEILFSLPAHVGPVSVVGDFNGWDPYAHPMRLDSDGQYSVAVAVPKGQAYAFRYLGDGGNWFDEEAAGEFDDRGAILRTPTPQRRAAMAKAASAKPARAKARLG